MIKKNILLFAFLCLLIFTGNSAFTEIYEAEVEDISNRKYFKATLDSIEKAEISITAAMYLVSLNPNNTDDPVKKLLDALIAAKKRGVDVKMILEYHSEKDFTPDGLNYYAYHYLKDNGMDIYFDKSSHRCLHAKAIVIDEETVITGSSNWSVPAFFTSDEINIIVESKPFAREIERYIREIPIREDSREKDSNSFYIPRFFLSSTKGALKRMVRAKDERSLDILLILWNNNKDYISCNYIAEVLGLAEKMQKNDYRRQIRKVLTKLETKYKQIRYEMPAGKDDISITLCGFPGEEPITFPKNYFLYGWNRRLSLAGKAVLITMYAELEEVNDRTTNLPISYLAKKYGLKVFTYSIGIQELKKYNIIKVQYFGGFKDRPPVRINIPGLYDMKEYDNSILKLNKQYGTDKVKEALNMADIVNGRYDVELVSDILIQIDLYGIDNARYAFSVIAKKSPDSYKRTYKYVIGILKKRGGQN